MANFSVTGRREQGRQRRAIRKALRVLGAPELARPMMTWKDFVQFLDRRA